MTIWCISKYASPPKYGTGARLFYLTKEFIRLGHEAVLITSDSNHLAKFPKREDIYNFETMDGVPVCWIKTKKYIKTASVSRVISWFDFEKKLFGMSRKRFPKPNVVIVSSLSIFSIVYGYHLKRKYGSFLVFDIRDIWPLTMIEEGGFGKWHPLALLIGWIEKYGYKKSDLITGTMPRLDLHVKSILGYDKPFFCSPLGFDPDSYTAGSMEEENDQFKGLFPEDRIIIGYAGSMGITNALDSFIGAIELLKDNKKIYFVLIGSGDLKNKYEKRLSGCDNVSFFPRAEQSRIKHFLDRCDILYLSTQNSRVWDYGQSMNKIVEYMLSAKPIIASYSGYPSMINEAGCGQFVEVSDPIGVRNAILDIISLKESDRREMGNNGKVWIHEHRQYSVLAEKYINEIEKYIDIKHKR